MDTALSRAAKWTQQSATVRGCVRQPWGAAVAGDCSAMDARMAGSSRMGNGMVIFLAGPLHCSRRGKEMPRSISLAVQVIIVLNLLLNFGHGLDFVGQLGGVHEVRINLGEIHERQVEPRELVDRETDALLVLG